MFVSARLSCGEEGSARKSRKGDKWTPRSAGRGRKGQHAYRIPRVLDLLPLSTQTAQDVCTLLLRLERDPLALHQAARAVLEERGALQQARAVARRAVRLVGVRVHAGARKELRAGELRVEVLGELLVPLQIPLGRLDARLVGGADRLRDALDLYLHLRNLRAWRRALVRRAWERRGTRLVGMHPSVSKGALDYASTQGPRLEQGHQEQRGPPFW